MSEPSPGTIYQALIEVKRAVKAVGKSDRNAQQNFDFRGIDAVLNAVSPALAEHGVTVLPELKAIDYGSVPTRNGGAMTTVHVQVAYHFVGPDGSRVTALVPAETFDSGDKATSKAMSVAYRTALIQVLSLPTQERDADADNYERAAPAQQPTRPQGDFVVQAKAIAPPAPAERDWIGQAKAITDLDVLLRLGRECSEAGDFAGPVRAAMLRRRRELETATNGSATNGAVVQGMFAPNGG